MKLFNKLLITGLVLAILLPFTFLKGKDGRPLMSFSDLKMPNLAMPELPDEIKMPDMPSSLKGKDVVYKWRNKRGELQFTSSPPPTDMEYTVKGYDPDTNLIQSVQIEVEEPEQEAKAEEPQVKNIFDAGSPYSPERINKLFDDAENIQKLIDDRMKNFDESVGQQ